MLEKINGPNDLKGLGMDQLRELADEVRTYLIDAQARTGGHVGPNLGVVELTVALHYVFDSPHDKIIWDVGHQCYVHKMLTGRLDAMTTMRQDGGSPGFPARDESPHDVLDTSHGGTSLSVALGLALANRHNGSHDLPVAVIGDGALVEGMAQEALNQIGNEKVRMLIVLNDNGRAIDANIGAIPNYLGRLRVGESVHDTMFTSLGIQYVGPIDGHDLNALVLELQALKDLDCPTVLHIKTRKGKGLPYVYESPIRLHFSFPFDKETGELILEPKEPNIFYKPKSKFNAVMIGNKIAEITKADSEVVIITPATRGALELHKCFNEVPDRCFDVGMAEQHAVTLAAGLVLGGMKPIVCFQATFFQRAFDQLAHDVCANNLPVLFILARSGLAGLDHATHHSPLDLSYLSCIPNLKILFPVDHVEFEAMLEKTVKNWIDGPTMLLFPYGTVAEVEPTDEERKLLSEDILDPKNAGIFLSTAGRIKGALALKKTLAGQGIDFAVLNVV